MSEFITKPVKIEATQWFEFGDHRAVFMDERYGPMVETRQGSVCVRPGDWIITLADGETYPCKPDVFAVKYGPAAAETATKPERFPKRTKLYLHSGKEGNYDKGEELGLSEKAIRDNFAYALSEVEFDVSVNEDGTYEILAVDGRALAPEVKK